MRKSTKIQDMELHHRNMNILMKFKDGFAPTWEVHVRWPGYKNRKYFTTVPAWNMLPSQCYDLVRDRIDIKLGIAWMNITTVKGNHRYSVTGVTSKGNYLFKELSSDNRMLRYNTQNRLIEVNIPDSDGKWETFIPAEDILKTQTWKEVA